MQILDVRIDNLTKKEILQKIEFFLQEARFHQICTVNPEFILHSQEDAEFKNILNSADLNVADGVGVWYAFLRHFAWLRTRWAGVDLLQEILKLAQEKKLSVFLAVNKSGLSSLEEIKDALSMKYPTLKIAGIELENKQQAAISNQEAATYQLPLTDYQILFCNFGAPQQELFINSVKNDRIRLAMGVGGAFDFMTGKIMRAPKIMRFLGLEWLFRFWQEPKYRAKRIWKAFPVFAWRVLINR